MRRLRAWLFASVWSGLSLVATAAPSARCDLTFFGETTQLAVAAEPDALGGVWAEFWPFRLRAVLAAPENASPWLLMEVYLQAEQEDWRLLSSQKVGHPFVTGQVEVVTPGMGRSLSYECQP
jgi:hypothetical protein